MSVDHPDVGRVLSSSASRSGVSPAVRWRSSPVSRSQRRLAATLSATAFGSVLPSTLYDVVLAAIVGPLAVAIVVRRQQADRVDW